jgi:prepilin-type N-terminal cleavage/methylation domain-containing protein
MYRPQSRTTLDEAEPSSQQKPGHHEPHVRRGLSLIEMLIVIAIIAVAMGMVLSAFWYAVKTVRSFKGHI